MNAWWSTMDLTAWCGDEPQGSSDLPFAHAIAEERARRRGIRQRVALNRGEATDVFRYVVTDVQAPKLALVVAS